MGYRVFTVLDRDKWEPRDGLEGPFFYDGGLVLYSDPRDGKYWDPKTDFYLETADGNV